MTEPEGEEQFEGAAGGGAAKSAPAEVEQTESSEPAADAEPEAADAERSEPEPPEPEPVDGEPESARADPEPEPPEPEPVDREPEPARADPEPEPAESPAEAEPEPADGDATPEAVTDLADDASVDVAEVMGAVLDQAAAQQPAPADDEVLVASTLPDLNDDAILHAALESLLLVVDSPAEDELLATTLELPVKRIREAMQALAARYTESGSGIDLRRVGDGWRLHTRDAYAPYVEKLLLDGQRAKLTRAALETLAVIAYRQPVSRSRVAAVRGVNVDGVIRTLVTRGLIEETGNDPDTGGILYRTTELFLERLGLSSLQDLPPIAPLLPEVDAIDDVG